MPELTNARFAQGLRELAEIYESDERMLQPGEGKLIFYVHVPASDFRGSVIALAAGGKVDKVPPAGKDEYYYRVRRALPSGLIVELATSRSEVCRKVQKMQLVETWECPDSLLDPE